MLELFSFLISSHKKNRVKERLADLPDLDN